MKRRAKHSLVWLCLFVSLLVSLSLRHTSAKLEAASQSLVADLILHNGFIWTVDEAKPQAEALAVRGDKLIKVGSNAEVLALKGAQTRVLDLQGAFVVPGFNDNHVHFANAASFYWNIQLMDVHTDATFVARIKEYLAAHPGEPIRGGGWGAYEQWEMGANKAGKKESHGSLSGS